VAYPSYVDGPSTEWFATPVSDEMFWDRYAPSNRWIQLSGRRWAATLSGPACAVRDGDPRVRLPPLATSYTRIAMTQKLRRIIDEGVTLGLALEGISAADVARARTT